jgi:hypothetical protein
MSENTNSLQSEEVSNSESNNTLNNTMNTANDSSQGELTTSGTSRTLGFIIGFFGLYFLVIGLFSLVAITVLKGSTDGGMPEKDIYAIVLTISSIFISMAAMFIGYKLIKRLDSGRKLFNVLVVVSILISIAQYTYNQNVIARSFSNMPPELAAAARGSESASSQLVFILPAVLVVLAIILNFGKVKEWLTR